MSTKDLEAIMKETYIRYITECLNQASERQLHQILIMLWHYMA